MLAPSILHSNVQCMFSWSKLERNWQHIYSALWVCTHICSLHIGVTMSSWLPITSILCRSNFSTHFILFTPNNFFKKHELPSKRHILRGSCRVSHYIGDSTACVPWNGLGNLGPRSSIRITICRWRSSSTVNIFLSVRLGSKQWGFRKHQLSGGDRRDVCYVETVGRQCDHRARSNVYGFKFIRTVGICQLTLALILVVGTGTLPVCGIWWWFVWHVSCSDQLYEIRLPRTTVGQQLKSLCFWLRQFTLLFKPFLPWQLHETHLSVEGDINSQSAHWSTAALLCLDLQVSCSIPISTNWTRTPTIPSLKSVDIHLRTLKVKSQSKLNDLID